MLQLLILAGYPLPNILFGIDTKRDAKKIKVTSTALRHRPSRASGTLYSCLNFCRCLRLSKAAKVSNLKSNKKINLMILLCGD